MPGLPELRGESRTGTGTGGAGDAGGHGGTGAAPAAPACSARDTGLREKGLGGSRPHGDLAAPSPAVGTQRDSPPHPPARAARRHRGREEGSQPGPGETGPRPCCSPGSAVRLPGPGRAGALRGLSVCRGSRISGRVRDGIWGGRGGAGGEPRGGASAPRGTGAVSPCSGESWGLLAELGSGGTSGTSARDDTVPAPPLRCRSRTRPRCHIPQGCWCRKGQGSWQGVRSAPSTEESRPLLTHPARGASAAGRSFPPYRGDLARPYPVLHFLRCSPDVPVGCHPPGTKPVEQSSCRNGGSLAHCPSGLAAEWVMVCPSEELGLKVPFIWWGRSAAPKTWTTGTWVPSATGPLYQAQPAADGLHQ